MEIDKLLDCRQISGYRDSSSCCPGPFSHEQIILFRFAIWFYLAACDAGIVKRGNRFSRHSILSSLFSILLASAISHLEPVIYISSFPRSPLGQIRSHRRTLNREKGREKGRRMKEWGKKWVGAHDTEWDNEKRREREREKDGETWTVKIVLFTSECTCPGEDPRLYNYEEEITKEKGRKSRKSDRESKIKGPGGWKREWESLRVEKMGVREDEADADGIFHRRRVHAMTREEKEAYEKVKKRESGREYHFFFLSIPPSITLYACTHRAIGPSSLLITQPSVLFAPPSCALRPRSPEHLPPTPFIFHPSRSLSLSLSASLLVHSALTHRGRLIMSPSRRFSFPARQQQQQQRQWHSPPSCHPFRSLHCCFCAEFTLSRLSESLPTPFPSPSLSLSLSLYVSFFLFLCARVSHSVIVSYELAVTKPTTLSPCLTRNSSFSNRDRKRKWREGAVSAAIRHRQNEPRFRLFRHLCSHTAPSSYLLYDVTYYLHFFSPSTSCLSAASLFSFLFHSSQLLLSDSFAWRTSRCIRLLCRFVYLDTRDYDALQRRKKIEKFNVAILGSKDQSFRLKNKLPPSIYAASYRTRATIFF